MCLQQEQPDFQPLSFSLLSLQTIAFFTIIFLHWMELLMLFSRTIATHQEMDVASAADWHFSHQSRFFGVFFYCHAENVRLQVPMKKYIKPPAPWTLRPQITSKQDLFQTKHIPEELYFGIQRIVSAARQEPFEAFWGKSTAMANWQWLTPCYNPPSSKRSTEQHAIPISGAKFGA